MFSVYCCGDNIELSALAFRDYNSRVYAIYNGGLPIGMLMQHDLDDDEVASNLYLGMGFYNTGEVDEDEVVMEYTLKDKE